MSVDLVVGEGDLDVAVAARVVREIVGGAAPRRGCDAWEFWVLGAGAGDQPVR